MPPTTKGKKMKQKPYLLSEPPPPLSGPFSKGVLFFPDSKVENAALANLAIWKSCCILRWIVMEKSHRVQVIVVFYR